MSFWSLEVVKRLWSWPRITNWCRDINSVLNSTCINCALELLHLCSINPMRINSEKCIWILTFSKSINKVILMQGALHLLLLLSLRSEYEWFDYWVREKHLSKSWRIWVVRLLGPRKAPFKVMRIWRPLLP